MAQEGLYVYVSMCVQSKEKLIVSLKDGSAVSKAGGTELAVLASELDSARQERDVLREQLQNTQLTLDSLRIEMTVSILLLLLLLLLL